MHVIRSLTLAIGLLGSGLAGAHHSFPAHYFPSTTTVEGVVTEYLFRNPHAFVHMQVTNDKGEVEDWAVELHNTIFLTQQGFGPDALKAGDPIVVTGNPARDGANRIRMVELVRTSDGLSMDRGNIRELNRERTSKE